jgi:hypothetical protein
MTLIATRWHTRVSAHGGTMSKVGRPFIAPNRLANRGGAIRPHDPVAIERVGARHRVLPVLPLGRWGRGAYAPARLNREDAKVAKTRPPTHAKRTP